MARRSVGDGTIGIFLRRVVPLLGLIYLIAYSSRQNVSFAKRQMLDDLGGFVAQNVAPRIKDRTSSTLASMLFLAGCLAFAGPMIFVVQGSLGRTARSAIPAE